MEPKPASTLPALLFLCPVPKLSSPILHCEMSSLTPVIPKCGSQTRPINFTLNTFRNASDQQPELLQQVKYLHVASPSSIPNTPYVPPTEYRTRYKHPVGYMPSPPPHENCMPYSKPTNKYQWLQQFVFLASFPGTWYICLNLRSTILNK